MSDYVNHFEPLNYNTFHIHEQHLRHKRSLRQDDHKVRIRFTSHGRNFNLELQRDHSVFHDDLVNEGGLSEKADISHIYEGKLANEFGSYCYGAIRDGVFDGQIHTKHGIYYVERANRYWKYDSEPKINFHSVIYHEKNHEDPFQQNKEGIYLHCLQKIFLQHSCAN